MKKSKKFISLLCSVACILPMVICFTSCMLFNNDRYESVSAMQSEFIGTWTGFEGFVQIVVGADSVSYISRDMETYEDTLAVYDSIIWNTKDGRIEVEDSDIIFEMSEDGQSIVGGYGGIVIFYKGGELAEKPMPTELLKNTVLGAKLSVGYGYFSASLEDICNQVVRDVAINYYTLEEYGTDFSYYEECMEIAKEDNTDTYIVTLEGEVSMNPNLDYMYTERLEFIKFVVVVDKNEVIYQGYFDMDGTFETAMILMLTD